MQMDRAQKALLAEEVDNHMVRQTLLIDMEYFVEGSDTALE